MTTSLHEITEARNSSRRGSIFNIALKQKFKLRKEPLKLQNVVKRSRNRVGGQSVAVQSFGQYMNENPTHQFKTITRPPSILSTMIHEPSKSFMNSEVDDDSPRRSIEIGSYNISLEDPRDFHEKQYVN
jgi:hypothetical protein